MKTTRRRFLQTSTGAAAATLGFPAILSSQSPNSKLNIAVIGSGGRGNGNMGSVVGRGPERRMVPV